MNRLRTKLTLLLVAALLLVAVIATTLSFLLLSPPRFHEIEDALASQWILVADLASHGDLPPPAPDRIIGVHEKSPSGEQLEGPTHGINAALAAKGRSERVAVLKTLDAPWPVIAGRLADGRWLWLPMTAPHEPPNQDWALFGWVFAMLIGTTLVMLVAVRRLTEPLALLERTVAAIGPGGEIEPLAEDGPKEVRAAARAINLLASRLKQAMESRIRLVAAAGHDLRTPMTRMRLRAEFLPVEERETWIADLNELDRIADSAIQLVREEVEGSTHSPIRLDGLVHEVVDELREVGLAVSLDSTVPVCVQARPLSLRRAIRNLAINAATHGGGAHLAVSSVDGHALVTLSDRGPGIPEALMGQVFEPFFRVDPARGAAVPGAGLGLAIAREIAIGNGGRLTLQNRPGGGLVQLLSFPAAG
ncbi:two-component sensor histidine kinase [Ancylobacter sonchi]|uniref:ATP-binding protein n=1 Tax=Ancylobacter sonchi TaxID=1937790 RepID=UPI001BD28497|nr:ATP-binding protein [Ancylobacter sonchi]MBS7534670.1 two-component sensor histidine kinase [Ancylobacter sonchi]